VTGAERRKQRLTWEAIGGHDPTPPDLGSVLRTMAIVGTVMFIVVFAASYPV
jgi:hypothetical protein